MASNDIIFLDQLGSEKSNFDVVDLSAIANRVQALGYLYSKMLVDSLNSTQSSSSGKLAESIQATEVEVRGKVFTVNIKANEYASYIDEGVDGWAKSRGSRFKFKTKGVDAKGKMVKSIKAYLAREGKANMSKYAVMNKKGKPKQDLATQNAVRAAYMIKRFGIAPNHFWRDATREMEKILADEFGEAIKVTIINNLKK